jgi:hypothetical protein
MLHIHNGNSSAETARNARIPGEHLAWREALACGPAPANLSDDEFLELRAQHLTGAYHVDVGACARELRRQQQALNRFGDHEEVVLWFEHDLFCQVHLVYLLNWFAQRDLGQTKLSLICIDQFSGVDDFRGLGQLNESQLESLLPQRREISEAQLQLGHKAWASYSSSTPELVEDLISTKTDALPFLKPAFTKHLERFPSVRNGLGRIENILLELIAGGHHDFKSLFAAFQQREPVYGFGDAQIFLHLTGLSKGPHLSLTMSNPDAGMDSSQIAEHSFELTEHGTRIFNSEADFVRVNGIDLWLGGVHLQGETAAWRWDEAAKTLRCGPDM